MDLNYSSQITYQLGELVHHLKRKRILYMKIHNLLKILLPSLNLLKWFFGITFSWILTPGVFCASRSFPNDRPQELTFWKIRSHRKHELWRQFYHQICFSLFKIQNLIYFISWQRGLTLIQSLQTQLGSF